MGRLCAFYYFLCCIYPLYLIHRTFQLMHFLWCRNARLEVSTALLLRINLRLGLASAPAGATVIVDRPEIKLARVELQRLQDLLSCPKESRTVHLQSAVDWGGLEPEERAI
jgi:hypothetical protein